MSIIAWIVLGLVAGFLGSLIVGGRGHGIIVDIILGVVGAVVGGFLFNLAGSQGVTGFNLWSLFVAVIGAIVLLVAFHGLRRLTSSSSTD